VIERTSDHGRFGPRWSWLFFAGPIIWFVYFWVVYRAADSGCTPDTGAVATWVSIGLLGGSLVGGVYYTWRAGKARAGGDETVTEGVSLLRAGLLVGAFLILATLLIGVPALVLDPC